MKHRYKINTDFVKVVDEIKEETWSNLVLVLSFIQINIVFECDERFDVVEYYICVNGEWQGHCQPCLENCKIREPTNQE